MVTPRIFIDPRVAVPSFAACALGFSAMSLLFFLPAFLQRVQHHSPAATGLLLLPLPAATAAGAALAGRWEAKAGPRAAMVTGFGLITAALFGLMAVAADSGYFVIAALLLPLGLGGGLALTSTNLAALGASLGIALLGTLLTTTATAASGRCPAGAVCDHLAEAYTVGLHVVVATAGTVTLAAAILAAPVGPLVTRVIRACARHPAGAGE
jgi:predicted MFS family arabinose efflux permease